MNQLSYWRKQTSDKPLFPNIEWSKPEQRSQAKKLAIIGGNKLGFLAPTEAYGTALKTGVGQCRVLLPEALKSIVPKTITDVIYGANNPSGGLSQDAQPEVAAIADWSDGLLLIGDAGKNSDTAILYQNLVSDHAGPLVITRDTIDLLMADMPTILERPDTVLMVSFKQLQKIFQSVYYPKVLTFSMQLLQLAEALHKFTTTYDNVAIVVLHEGTLLVSRDGQVVSQDWPNPMALWTGSTATRAAVYYVWNPTKPLESITASIAAQPV